MKRTIVWCMVCVTFLGSGVSSVFAESNRGSSFSLGVQTGYVSGYTAYEISEFSGNSSLDSQLKFPLKAALAGVRMGFRRELSGGNELKLSLSWMKNIGNGVGKVEDSDWMSNDLDIANVGASHPGLDIYSESDMRLKADVYDVRGVLGFGLGEHFRIGPMLGYKHQSIRYEVSNVDQVGYGPYAAAYTVSVAGLAGTYKVEYDMPYAGFSGEFSRALTSGEFTATAQVGIAYVSAKDRDDHILRSKLSTTSADGSASLVDFSAVWTFPGHWSVGLNGEVLDSTTLGTQHQYYYGGPYAGQSYSIDNKITSTQWTSIVSLGYSF
jgi:Omptin family